MVEATDSERGMNPVTMTTIDPWKEYWQSRGSNQEPPVHKSATLPTELWGPKRVKGGYLDFSHVTELENIYITEIYLKK